MFRTNPGLSAGECTLGIHASLPIITCLQRLKKPLHGSSVSVSVLLDSVKIVNDLDVYKKPDDFLLHGNVRSLCDGSSDRYLMVDPLSYFLFQQLFHDWCIKGCDMCYPVCGLVHVQDPLLLIRKCSSCTAAAGFFSRYLNGPLLYPRRHITVNKNVLSVSLSKTFHSFPLYIYIYVKPLKQFPELTILALQSDVLQESLYLDNSLWRDIDLHSVTCSFK